MEVRSFTDDDSETWDCFCRGSRQATFLHSRRFLSYHRGKFVDASLMIHDAGRLVAVFPAALDPYDASTVVSHPGATYGGIVNQGHIGGRAHLEILSLMRTHYRQAGKRQLIYKPVPFPYHGVPAQDDLYALFRLDAQRVRCDLSSTVDLQHRAALSTRRIRSLRKALSAGVVVSRCATLLPAFWAVLESNLASKRGLAPTHTLEEMSGLLRAFPDQIILVTGLLNGNVVGGTLIFSSVMTWHAQYISSSVDGNRVSALDAVFGMAISEASAAGARYFDFGISTEQQGRFLNSGLHQFKSEFGAGSTVYEHYLLELGS